MRTAEPAAQPVGSRTAEPESPPGLPPWQPWPVTSISTGLRAHRHHGDLTALIDNFTSRGILHPLTVTPDGRLVTGARRLAAARLAGCPAVPARTVTTVEEALQVLAWEAAQDGMLGLPREPWTVTEALWLDAAIRELEWWPRASVRSGQSPREDHRQALAAAADGPGGKRFWNQSQYNHARRLWQAAHQGFLTDLGSHSRSPVPASTREAALAALAALDTAGTRLIQRAYRAWRTSIDGSRSRLFEAAAVPGLLAALKGTTTAISSAGRPGPDVTPADLQAIYAEATRLIRATSQFRRGTCQ